MTNDLGAYECINAYKEQREKRQCCRWTHLLTTKRDPSTSLRLYSEWVKEIREESANKWEEKRREEKRGTNPLVVFDVEVVEGDMSGGEENLVDEGIDSLEHGEIEHLRALLIQIRRQFLRLRHLSLLKPFNSGIYLDSFRCFFQRKEKKWRIDSHSLQAKNNVRSLIYSHTNQNLQILWLYFNPKCQTNIWWTTTLHYSTSIVKTQVKELKECYFCCVYIIFYLFLIFLSKK